MAQNEEMRRAHNEEGTSEMRKMLQSARYQFENIFQEQERITLHLEAEKRELERREKELVNREAYNEKEGMRLSLEKQMVIESLEELNRALVVKERKSNDECQAARRALKEQSFPALIGVKRMGELDRKLFHDAAKRRCLGNEVDEKAGSCAHYGRTTFGILAGTL